MKVNRKKENHWGWYTSPKLVTWKNNLKKAWFVKFEFTDKETSVTKPIQIRGGINYDHTIKERNLTGNATIILLLEQLKNDWHPIFLKCASIYL